MPTRNPISGFMYFVKGFRWLMKPGIKRFIVIPVIINIVLYSLLVTTGIFLMGYLGHLLPHWLRWLVWLFWILFFLGSAVIVIYTFTILANLIGAPFNSFLSEKVEFMATGKKLSDQGLKSMMKDMPRVFKREWLKIKYYLPRAIFLLVLFFIPVINIAASVLWFIFGSWMMAMQYVDYPFDNHQTTFDDMYQFLRKNCVLSLSFGAGVILVSLIPVLNFFVMPAAVIGATLMWLDYK
ncbi:MAG: sulfate transporter CysZ [Gammaproteobacteria bacterium]|nr:sulfate transporter CysZ [Gammaproteobacteria bacterium]